jgi:hypothetical protein
LALGRLERPIAGVRIDPQCVLEDAEQHDCVLHAAWLGEPGGAHVLVHQVDVGLDLGLRHLDGNNARLFRQSGSGQD